jgi:dihydrodipicolinate synthase/N-acetylneuraminate lyase
MARFTTRVQLTGSPDGEDYDKLHKAMKRKGFSRIIKGSGGDYFWLPHAEYNLTADMTVDAVLDAAVAAAGTVRSGSKVLVSEATNRKWIGLDEATAADAAAN